MNTRGVNALAGVIGAAMQTRQTAAGIAMAVEAAGMLQPPETSQELVRLRDERHSTNEALDDAVRTIRAKSERIAKLEARLVPLPDYRLNPIRDRVAAATDGPWEQYPEYGPTFYANVRGEYLRGVGDINFGVGEQAEADLAFVLAAPQDVPLLLDHIRVLETVLADSEARVAELEQQLAARTFYLAESEDAENGPSLHATHVAAIAWCDEVEPGDWFEDDGVWVQCDTDSDTDRPTTRGAGTVTPLAVQGDGVDAEAERLRREFLEKSRKLADLQRVREDERECIRDLQKQQGEVMKALGCGRHDEWDEVVHRARQLAGGSAVSS